MGRSEFDRDLRGSVAGVFSPPAHAFLASQKCAQSVPSKLGLEAAPRVKSGHLESCA